MSLSFTSEYNDLPDKPDMDKFGLNELYKLSELGYDSNGVWLFRKYPYRLSLRLPAHLEPLTEINLWLTKNVGEDNYKIAWVSVFYFKHEEDALLFKLTWL